MPLSRSVLAWISVFTALLLAGMALGNSPLLVVALLMLTFPVLGALVSAPTRVRVVRSLPRHTYWVGDTARVHRRVTVSNGMGPVFIYDDLPDSMSVIEGSNVHVIWKWPGQKTFDLSYEILCPKRGTFVLGNTAWEAEDPLRFRNPTQGTGDGDLELSVVPRFLGVQRIARARSKAVAPFPDADLAKTGVSTTDFMELREYAKGDPVKSINWKATARHSTSTSNLLVNKYQPEGRRAVWLFLDGASYMEVGTTLSNPFEHALEATFSLAEFYISRGYTLGAYVYNSPGGYLSPDVGQKQLHRLKQKLLTLQTSDTEEGLPAAAEWCKHSLLHLQPESIVITRLDAYFARPMAGKPSFQSLLAGVKRLAATKGRGQLRRPVSVFSVGGYAYYSGADALEARTADLVRWETQPLARRLRRSGATVLQWDSSREQFATVLLRHLSAGKVAG